MIRGWLDRLGGRLATPVDGSSVAALRIVFGAAIVYESIALWPLAPGLFIDPPFHFKYGGFAFVEPWSAGWVYFALTATLAAALALMAGWCCRAAAAGTFVGFGYLFLLEEALYLNHFYLMVVVAFLLTVVRTDRWASVDQYLRRVERVQTVPLWHVLILRAQVVIVYFYGGLAKLNGDWLRGEPVSEWLGRREAFPFVGHLLTEDWVTLWVFSYGGLVFDLSIGFLLLSRRTRDLALIPLLFFHVTNALVFHIGVFPWLSLGLTVIFFDPGGPRALLDDLREKWLGKRRRASESGRQIHSQITWRKRTAAAFFVGWIAVQSFVPLRHWLYPGNVNWTEEGHRFSWRMKLRDKQGWLTFAVTDRETGATVPFTPVPGYAPEELQLTRLQLQRMTMCPRLAVQYAHYLHRNAHLMGLEDPEVRVVCLVSLNGRPHQLLIDPEVDLARVEPPWIGPAEWIVPLLPDQPIGLYEPLDLDRFDGVLRARFPDNPFWERYPESGKGLRE
ncbi:MAG: HTTM domain-containing protein [Planctomycetota bacterium]